MSIREAVSANYHDDPTHRTDHKKFQQECPDSHHHPNLQQMEKSICRLGSLKYLCSDQVLQSTSLVLYPDRKQQYHQQHISQCQYHPVLSYAPGCHNTCQLKMWLITDRPVNWQILICRCRSYQYWNIKYLILHATTATVKKINASKLV